MPPPTAPVPSDRSPIGSAFRFLQGGGIAVVAAVCDLAYACYAIPRELVRASTVGFIGLSVVSALSGAQRWVMTALGTAFAAAVLNPDPAAQAIVGSLAVISAGAYFSGRWLDSIADYHGQLCTIGMRKETRDRLAEGLFGQNLARLADKDLINESATVKNNSWFTFVTGRFFYSLVSSAVGISMVGASVLLGAPPTVQWLVAAMIVPSIITTLYTNHAFTRDEKRFANDLSRMHRLSDYLTGIEFIRGIKLEGGKDGMMAERNALASVPEAAELKRTRLGFWMSTVSHVVYGVCILGCMRELLAGADTFAAK